MAKRSFKLLSAILCLAATITSLAGLGFQREAAPRSTTVSALPFAFTSYSSTGDATAERDMYSPCGILTPSSISSAQSRRNGSLKDKKLYVGGMSFGVKFMTDGLLLVGFCDVLSNGKEKNPAKEAGLAVGDRIISANGVKLSSSEELSAAAHASNGKALTLTCQRNGQEFTVTVKPVLSDTEGKYKTGVFVRDSGAGIGTVSYIIPETGEFGGLGHGICDADTGKIIPMNRGSVVGVTISGIKKGEVGTPGEVKGYFSSGKCGSLMINSECGVFGCFGDSSYTASSYLLPIGARSEVKSGKATIRTTLDGNGPKEYEIEISDINRTATGNKCFTVKVTDQDLLNKTGGIVQGMSGSPIIQNGKIVGAITHVLINDPTTGYGIFIENMLNAAQMPMAKAS